jgi:hypothetical protein
MKTKPHISETHQELLAKWMAGKATRGEMRVCMDLDRAHVQACKEYAQDQGTRESGAANE